MNQIKNKKAKILISLLILNIALFSFLVSKVKSQGIADASSGNIVLGNNNINYSVGIWTTFGTGIYPYGIRVSIVNDKGETIVNPRDFWNSSTFTNYIRYFISGNSNNPNFIEAYNRIKNHISGDSPSSKRNEYYVQLLEAIREEAKRVHPDSEAKQNEYYNIAISQLSMILSVFHRVTDSLNYSTYLCSKIMYLKGNRRCVNEPIINIPVNEGYRDIRYLDISSSYPDWIIGNGSNTDITSFWNNQPDIRTFLMDAFDIPFENNSVTINNKTYTDQELNNLYIVIEPMTIVVIDYQMYAGTAYELAHTLWNKTVWAYNANAGKSYNYNSISSIIRGTLPLSAYVTGTITGGSSYFGGLLNIVDEDYAKNLITNKKSLPREEINLVAGNGGFGVALFNVGLLTNNKQWTCDECEKVETYFEPYTFNGKKIQQFTSTDYLKYLRNYEGYETIDSLFSSYNAFHDTNWTLKGYIMNCDKCHDGGQINTNENPYSCPLPDIDYTNSCYEGNSLYSEYSNRPNYWEQCIYNSENNEKTKYKTSLSYKDEDLSSKYCEVYCIEEVNTNFINPNVVVEAGRYFSWDNNSISGSRTCKTKSIDYNKFNSDLNSINNQYLNNTMNYNTYKQNIVYLLDQINKCSFNYEIGNELYNLNPDVRVNYSDGTYSYSGNLEEKYKSEYIENNSVCKPEIINYYINLTEEGDTYGNGDVNGDGKVNQADYLFVQRHIQGTYTLTEEQKKRADVNLDGQITATDYTIIEQNFYNNPAYSTLPVKAISVCSSVEITKEVNIEYKVNSEVFKYVNKQNNQSFSGDNVIGSLNPSFKLSQLISESNAFGNSLNYIDIGYGNFPVAFSTKAGTYGKAIDPANKGLLSLEYSNLGHLKSTSTTTEVDIVMSEYTRSQGLLEYGDYQCNYEVTNRGSIKEPYKIVVYRPISLEKPFPGMDGLGRSPGSNWQAEAYAYYEYDYYDYKDNAITDDPIEKYITYNRGVEKEEVYNLEPMYRFILTPKKILEIREYNKTTNYDDFNMECVDGKKCISEYLSRLIEETDATGVCIGSNRNTIFDTCRY